MADQVNPVYLQPGTRVGFYEIVTLVGKGGFGALYKVTRDGEAFALKLATFKTEELSDEERQAHEERADREVVALKSLRHPNIVRVHAFERWPDLRRGYPYIVMDFVEGHRLYDWRAHKTPSLRRIAEVFRKIALALNEMHRLEVFHRDLKSENVLVRTDDEPVIVDFGISRPRSTYTVTRADVMIGTYTHFPPEYCKHFGSEEFKRGERFVYRATADLHAVGYMLYHCLTGRPPFNTRHDNAIDLIEEIATVVPAAPSQINPRVPSSIERVAMRLLEKEPERRYQSGAELAEALALLVEAADVSWEVPLDVPPRPAPAARVARREDDRSAVPPESARSIDVVLLSTGLPPEQQSPRTASKAEAPLPSAEAPRRPPEIASPAGSPAAPVAAFAAPTSHGEGFSSPEAPVRAPTAPVSAASELRVPSVIRREAAKIEAARTAARRSRLRTPLLIGGGLVGVLALTFAVSRANTVGSDKSKPLAVTGPSGGTEPAEAHLGTGLAANEPVTNENLEPKTPPNIRAGGEPRGTAPRNVDEAAVDEMLAKTYGRPTLPAEQPHASNPPSGPTWLMRGERKQPAAEPPAAASKKYGVPMGAKIRARLVTNLDSRTIADGPVEAILVRPFVQRGSVVFPSRTMLYGRATTSSGRFVLSLDRLRLPDDTEVPFAGLAIDPEDSKPGLPAARRISSPPAREQGLTEKLAKNTAGSLLAKAATDEPRQLASAAGQTILQHQEAISRNDTGDALLLDRGSDFDVFVREAF